MDLTDAQWAVLEPLLPKPRRRPDGRGRPWRDPRDVLNGILWILKTGAPWHDLPDRYPPGAHRRARPCAPGPGRGLSRAGPLGPLRGLHRWHLRHREKRGPGVGVTKRGKGTKIMVVGDRAGLPLAVHVASAAAAEVTLVEATVASCFTTALPARRSATKPMMPIRWMPS